MLGMFLRRRRRVHGKGVIVENQKIGLFRQKNRWGLTVLSIVLCFALAPVIGMAAVLPQVIALAPVALTALLGYVGPVSAVVCTGVCVGMGGTLYGLFGVVCALLLFVPVLLISVLTVERQKPFWQSAGIGAGAMFISMCAVIGLLTVMTGSDVVTAFTRILRDMFADMGTMADSLLMLFSQMGMVALPEGVDLTVPGAALTADMREEMISMIALIMDSALRLELPAQMATGSVIAGVLGQVMLRKAVLARGVAVEYPRLRTWRLPKGWGRVLGCTLILFYVAAQLMPERMNSMFYVFRQIFDMVFVMQGIGALCYLLHKNGKGRGWQLLVFVAGYFMLRSVAMMLGIADQAVDFTHRRKELDSEDNPYDPFGRRPEA